MQDAICFITMEWGSHGNRTIVHYAFDSVFDSMREIIKAEIISVLL
jgi:hypothetical protein